MSLDTMMSQIADSFRDVDSRLTDLEHRNTARGGWVSHTPSSGAISLTSDMVLVNGSSLDTINGGRDGLEIMVHPGPGWTLSISNTGNIGFSGQISSDNVVRFVYSTESSKWVQGSYSAESAINASVSASLGEMSARVDTVEGSLSGKASSSHSATHVSEGSDEFDGDRMDIDWVAIGYTPSAAPSEVDTTANLTAHLYGIGQELAGKVSQDGTVGSVFFDSVGDAIYPLVDDTMTCGKSGQRWSAVWSANGTIQTSDIRYKSDVSQSDLGLDFILSLNPLKWRWHMGASKTHYGFSAQSIAEIAGSGFGGYVYDEETDQHSLIYTEFIAPLVRAVQEQQEEIDRLKDLLEKHVGQ